MPKLNFSENEKKIYDLTLDLATGNYSSRVDTEKLSRRDLEDYLRTKINDELLQGRTLYQAYRRNNLVLFEIIEEIVNVTIGENVFNSPFVDAFVEYKNRKFGDTSAFYTEGGLLSVASFAGNHWDTNRQALDLGDEIVLPKEWIYIHVYEELDRFLLGVTPPDKILDKIYQSVNRYIQDRLYAQFQNVAQAIPSAFSATGNSEEAIGTLCDIVQAAGNYASLTIAGTKGALRKFAGVIPDKYFANSQKEAKNSLGAISEWEGNKILVIPQTLKSGTFQTALSNSQVFILGGDTKPIKLEFIGDTRSDFDTTGKKNNDQTVDLQVQTLMGIGLVLPPAFGCFTFT